MSLLIAFTAVCVCLEPYVAGFLVSFTAPWMEWSSCSQSCGGGHHSRRYNCTALNQFTREYFSCAQYSVPQTQACNTHPCLVDGNWGPWSVWSLCSITCGEGTSIRSRACNNPPPSNGGTDCHGAARETTSCSLVQCPLVLDGKWGGWSTWSQCSVTCGTGAAMRSRACDSPPPSSAGEDCQGATGETTSCSLVQCTVDGNWSEWSRWSGCTKTCGSGMKSRARSCNNPKPSNGGQSCNGQYLQTVHCNQNACPVDGHWSEWTPYSPCDATCGNGTRSRFRICDSPHPSDDGKYCIGSGYEISSCVAGPCVPPTSHVCNGSKIFSTVIHHTSVSHTGDHNCLLNNNHPPEAVLEDFCSAPNKQTWTFHTKVVDTCSTVPMYAPVGFLDMVAEEENYGIFMGCTQTGFKLASQDCQTALHISIIDHDASKFHVILW